jgi:hypothetical protein
LCQQCNILILNALFDLGVITAAKTEGYWAQLEEYSSSCATMARTNKKQMQISHVSE